MEVHEAGRVTGVSGLDIRVEICEAWRESAVDLLAGLEEGLGRSFLVGRWEGWERDVGMDSGIGSDIVLKDTRLWATSLRVC